MSFSNHHDTLKLEDPFTLFFPSRLMDDGEVDDRPAVRRVETRALISSP